MAKRHTLAFLSTVVGVAGLVAVSAAQADVSTYLSIRTSFLNFDDEQTDGDYWDIADHSSRFGFRGSVDIGGGRTAVAHYEFRVNSDSAGLGSAASNSAQRLSYVGVTGLAGGAGALTIGSQWSPYYNYLGGMVDLHNAMGTSLSFMSFRRADSLLYVHSTDAFSLGVMGLFSDDCPTGTCPVGADQEDPEEWNIAASFKAGPVTIGVGTITDEGPTGQDVTGVAGSLAIGENGYLGVLIESQDGDATNPLADDLDSTTVIYEHKSGKNRYRVSMESLDNGTDLDGTAVGWEHKMTDNSRVWIEYETLEYIPGAGNSCETVITPTTTCDQTKLSLGIRVDL